MSMNKTPLFRPLALACICALGVSTTTLSAPTKLANGPLANAADNNPPNLMFILDDSGSMRADATPDYIKEESLCRKSGDNTSGNTFELCRLGDPPYMNYDFNFQYYNPGVRYMPAVNYDGTSRTSYTDPTNVPTDAFGVLNLNQFFTYGAVATMNLATNYPDRVWCKDADDDPSSSDCKRNGVSGFTAYRYPNLVYRFSRNAGFTGRCQFNYPTDSPPDYDCSAGQSQTIAFPKYLGGAPYYYNILPSEHCTNADLTTCVFSETPTTISGTTYNIPAKIRWCSNTALTTCQARKDATYRYSTLGRIGAVATGTITVGNQNSNTSVSAVTINGVNLISGNTSASNNRDTVAARIAAAINAHESEPDYVATASGQTVTIRAVDAGLQFNGLAISVTNQSGSKTYATSDLTGGLPIAKMERVNIVPGTNSYPKGASRTDCAGATCTYAEEVTNFNNWYAYYRTRMNMTKSAVGRAFASIDDSYRVGFITINPGSPVNASKFLAVEDFALGAGLQKDKWYEKLYGTQPTGSTPLREALSRVGRYFAGKTENGTISAGMGNSPIEASCQQNFAILSTDGYWNGNGGRDLDNNAIGNYDNSLGTGANQVPRPLYDGGGTSASGTLADVAQYYYNTDLRTDLANNVPTTAKDNNARQHMTTFTIGLGLAGRLKYEANYESSTTGDFYKLKQGTLNWPVPAQNTETALDDLWHAAVNGRGQFFSARNPEEVVDGLYTALSALQIRIGAGAAAATSNLQPVAGDNFAFTAEYTTVDWTGDLKARQLDLNTGALLPGVLWSAQALLEPRTAASRTIYTATTDTGTYPSKLKPFTFAALTAAERAFFNPALLGQYAGWSTGQRSTATATNLVDFLRGDKTYYDSGAVPALDTDLYRARVKLFGDIINAQPAYVRASPLTYNDYGHSQFAGCTAGTFSTGCPSGLTGTALRIGTVFAAANDGMLHAFNSDAGGSQGQERWAFIPSMVLPDMYRLANSKYSHQYYVDGSPVTGDICVASDCTAATVTASNWRTIIVGGLNAGGRGFYALDITNPAAGQVKLLWEFKVRDPAVTSCASAVVGTNTDCDVGFSFAQPVITKRKSDGKWVVLVTSGYNNFNPGNGKGYLYVLDAATGVVLNKVGLPVSAGGSGGSASPAASACPPAVLATPYCDADPVGLAKINVRIENNVGDNTAVEAYGGDLKGRLWRFDLSSATNTYPDGFMIAQLSDASSNPQPVTVRPEIGVINGTIPAVFLGTGKYLGNDDPGDDQVQTIYGIRADGTASISDVRGGDLVRQTLSNDTTVAGGEIRTITTTASVDWATKKGWYIDLPQKGERVNVDPGLQVGTLVVPSNVPTTDACTAGGFGYFNTLDYARGTAIEGAANQAASQKVNSALVVGVNSIKLPGNKLVSIITRSDNVQITLDLPVKIPGLGGRRVSWREIIID